ncbi:MAG: GUN4 domain-containing protein [Cyanobacteria bacterium P01_D01_bin.73]
MEALWLLVGVALGSSFTLAIAGRFPQRSNGSEKTTEVLDNTDRFDQLAQQLQTLQSWHESHHHQLESLNERISKQSLEQPELPIVEPAAMAEPQSNPLASEVGLDYAPLNQYLGMGQWVEADQVTRDLLAAAVGMPANAAIAPEDWQRLPATDLRTMDNLWRYWSGDRFGFAAQAQLWQAADNNYEKFCDSVGWRSGDEWIYREDLDGDRSAPVGHWPAIAWGARSCYGIGSGVASQNMAGLMERAIAILLA